MAFYYSEPSHTFSEYLLVPGYTSPECVPANVSLRTPLVKFRKGQEECPISLSIPMVSAIMQSVSNDTLAVALAREGGLSFIYGSQSVESEAAMVARVKGYKAGFVPSDSNLPPEATLQDVLDLKARNGHSTVAITADGTNQGRLLGIVTSRDYRVSRMDPATPVSAFMTPYERLVTAPEGTTLKEANDIIWDHKLNSLPIVSTEGRLLYFVFRKDYEQHKENPGEMLDGQKRYMVGAGINTKDYAQRVPALIEAGADVLCIDSSEGYSCWQAQTLAFIREKYGDRVKVGAGNVVDRDGFRFLAQAGADLIIVDHAHVLQPLANVEGVPTIYSLGNYWFNSSTLNTCLVKVTLKDGEMQSFQFLPALQSGCYTKLLSGVEKEAVLEYMRGISGTVEIDAEGYVTF